MKLKTEVIREVRHTGSATCVGWINSEEVLSCGDDHQLLRTNVLTHEVTTLCKLPQELWPLDMHWPSRSPGVTSAGSGASAGTSARKSIDIILLTSGDGKFHLISRTGRIERSVEAHQGACLVGRWSHDGAGFMTTGEDGLLKIWSRSGMLRSTLTACEGPIYSGAWAPDSQAVCHSNGRLLFVRSLAANTKPIRWKAHEGLILKISWCVTSGLIVSGGEDCRYRVWDSLGSPVYVSGYHEYPITSVAWSPSGEMFAVGGYNTLRICDSSGWSEHLEKPETGSLYQLSWSSDGTQISASCANGHILYAHVIGKKFDWRFYSATVTDKKTISVKNLNQDIIEQLDFPDRIIQVTFRYDYLVATTPTQCHIYNTSNWNTPIIFDLKESAVTLLLSCEKYIAIIEKTSISIYNYQGRIVFSPRWQGMHPEGLSRATVALSNDMFVVRDNLDPRVLHLFDLGTSRSNPETQIQHSSIIIEIALSQAGPSVDRHLAVIDTTRNLYLVPIREFGTKPFLKLGSQIQSIQWNLDIDVLAVIQDGHLAVWYAPVAAAYNPRLLRMSMMEQDADLRRNPRIHSFEMTTVHVRRSDGSLITLLISPYILNLHRSIMENKWESALKLCRTVQEDVLWATFAALATHAKMLDMAEEAFAATNQHDKVEYIQRIKEFPNRSQQTAGALLLKGANAQSESMLLQNGLLFHAIYNNLNSYSWNRALDLALKHKSHVDIVLFVRKKYLESLGKPENNQKFIQLNNTVDLDEELIQQKITQELIKS